MCYKIVKHECGKQHKCDDGAGVEFRNTRGESKKILLKHFARILRVIMCRVILLKKSNMILFI